jgi:hypothetical protein
VVRRINELRKLADPSEPGIITASVTLFGNDNIRLTKNAFVFRFVLAHVPFFPVNEHYDIGILFNRS